MTTVTAPRGVLDGGPVWTGTWAVARTHLRTSWRALVVWPLVIAGALAGTAAGVAGLYADAADRAVYAATVGDSPATVAFNGPGLDLDSIGGIAAYEGGFLALLLVPMIAVHLAVRLTRAQEEQGMVELVTAARVGRVAPLLAGAAVTWLALLVGGLLTWAGMVAAGLPADGAGWYAAGLVGLTTLFAGVGLVAAELAQTARSAYLVGAGTISVLFAVRAAVDVALLPDDVTSGLWATPMGWMSAVRPFGEPAVWPLVALLVATALLTGAAVWIREQRDLGAGVVPERGGPARGALRTVDGLVWRLLRPSTIAWVVSGAFWGTAFGLLAREVRVLTETNPALAEVVGGAATENLLAFGLVLMALMAAAAVAQSAGRVGREEVTGRAGLMLSTAVPRTRWWAALVGWTALPGLVTLLLGGLGLGVGAWIADGDGAAAGAALGATVWYLPALAAVVGLAVLGVTVAGRSLPLGWVVVGVSAAVALLGDAMDLPQWARDLSLLEHVGTVPAGDGAPAGAVALTALAAACLAVSWWRFTHRDLAAG